MPDSLHPWEPTLAELLARVRAYYGEEQGEAAARTFEALASWRGIERDERLEPDVVRYLLTRAGLPVEDHGLEGE